MADIELIVKIPEGLKKDFESEQWTALSCMEMKNALEKATPLPKGHGRLMILSDDKLKENQINLDVSCQKWISEVGLSNATVAIIEADKAESEVGNGNDD